MTPRLFVPGDAGAVALGADEVASALQAAAVRGKAQIEIVRCGNPGAKTPRLLHGSRLFRSGSSRQSGRCPRRTGS
jgi:hypothetical protein